jgi:flavin reductase (DIM6/NTAB) family NADH-FMN oxidoreductase RutF
MKNLIVSIFLFAVLIFFGLFVFRHATEAQNGVVSNLLNLPAPPNPSIEEVYRTRTQDFLSKSNPPKDDAPIEDVLEYWENQNKLDRFPRYEPVAYVPSNNKILIFGASYDEESESVESAGGHGNHFLLDADTGMVQPVKGEIRPLAQQTFLPLQPAANADEFWAAIPDREKNETQIGVYNAKTFTFKSLLTVPQIRFDSMDMQADEKENKIYLFTPVICFPCRYAARRNKNTRRLNIYGRVGSFVYSIFSRNLFLRSEKYFIQESQMPINKNEFRAALGRFASGVTVVTTRDASGRLYGITVSAFCSVSLEPPLVLVCVEKKTGSHHAFSDGEAFVVNVLAAGQQHLSDRFASHISDKFAGVSYHQGIADLPVLEDALANLECVLKYSYEAGDHTIFVGQIEKARVADGEPLLYFHGNYRKIKELP